MGAPEQILRGVLRLMATIGPGNEKTPTVTSTPYNGGPGITQEPVVTPKSLNTPASLSSSSEKRKEENVERKAETDVLNLGTLTGQGKDHKKACVDIRSKMPFDCPENSWMIWRDARLRNKDSLSLLHLPKSIRRRIYAYALQHPVHSGEHLVTIIGKERMGGLKYQHRYADHGKHNESDTVEFPYNPWSPTFLFLVSRKVYMEALSVLHEQTTFQVVLSKGSLPDFLNLLSLFARSQIQKLHLHLESTVENKCIAAIYWPEACAEIARLSNRLPAILYPFEPKPQLVTISGDWRAFEGCMKRRTLGKTDGTDVQTTWVDPMLKIQAEKRWVGDSWDPTVRPGERLPGARGGEVRRRDQSLQQLLIERGARWYTTGSACKRGTAIAPAPHPSAVFDDVLPSKSTSNGPQSTDGKPRASIKGCFQRKSHTLERLCRPRATSEAHCPRPGPLDPNLSNTKQGVPSGIYSSKIEGAQQGTTLKSTVSVPLPGEAAKVQDCGLNKYSGRFKEFPVGPYPIPVGYEYVGHRFYPPEYRASGYAKQEICPMPSSVCDYLAVHADDVSVHHSYYIPPYNRPMPPPGAPLHGLRRVTPPTQIPGQSAAPPHLPSSANRTQKTLNEMRWRVPAQASPPAPPQYALCPPLSIWTDGLLRKLEMCPTPITTAMPSHIDHNEICLRNRDRPLRERLLSCTFKADIPSPSISKTLPLSDPKPVLRKGDATVDSQAALKPVETPELRSAENHSPTLSRSSSPCSSLSSTPDLNWDTCASGSSPSSTPEQNWDVKTSRSSFPSPPPPYSLPNADWDISDSCASSPSPVGPAPEVSWDTVPTGCSAASPSAAPSFSDAEWNFSSSSSTRSLSA